jgi:hypothetical protein
MFNVTSIPVPVVLSIGGIVKVCGVPGYAYCGLIV